MDKQQDNGASLRDRAVAADAVEPVPVSSVPASIPSAIKHVLDPHFDKAEKGMYGDRADFLAWREIRRSIPGQIVEALAAAGYALTPVNRPFKARLSKLDEQPYRFKIRAQMEVPSQIIQAEQLIDALRWQEPKFRYEYLPSLLARSLCKVFEDDVARRLHAVLAQGIEARSGETGTGSTEGENPVACDAPDLTPCNPPASIGRDE